MYMTRLCSIRGAQNISKHFNSLTYSTLVPHIMESHTENQPQPRCNQRNHEHIAQPIQSDLNASAPVFHSSNEVTIRGIQNVAQSLQTVSIIDEYPSTSLPVRLTDTQPIPVANLTRKEKRELRIKSLQKEPKIKSTPRPRTMNGRGTKIEPSKASGGRPSPSEEYLAASSVYPHLLPFPQHLLVVIDLNGTLLYRPNRKQPTKFVARPFSEQFLKYCVDTFTVVIWSSARAENVTNMCATILTGRLREQVTAIWGRDKFDLTTEDFDKRVQCYKRLTKLWTDPAIIVSHPAYETGGRWDQTNTVLVDDSYDKARSEPHNLIEIPEFFGNENEAGRILPQVHDYLNYLSMYSNVSAVVRANPFKANLTAAGLL